MATVQNLDFLNLNSLRNFPIREGLSPITQGSSGDVTFKIPETFIVDLVLSATTDVTRRFFISEIQNYPEVIIIEISDYVFTGDFPVETIVGTFTITAADHIRFKEYYLAPSTSFPGAQGKIVIGDLEDIAKQPAGKFIFNISSSELEARCSIPSTTSISHLLFVDEKGTTHSLTGDVRILARNNVRFRIDALDSQRVIIDAGDGLGLNKICDNGGPCIKTINNIAPDEDGNFTFIGTECALFTELSNPPGLMLEETCCKPCLGCDEISQLTQRTIQVETDLIKLRDFVNNLNNLFTDLSNKMNFSCEC